MFASDLKKELGKRGGITAKFMPSWFVPRQPWLFSLSMTGAQDTINPFSFSFIITDSKPLWRSFQKWTLIYHHTLV